MPGASVARWWCRFRRRGPRVALLLALTLAGTPALAVPDAVQLAEELRRATEALRSQGQVMVAGRRIRSAATLPEIYELHGFRPLWIDPANQEALLGEIAAASGDGLNPADYHFEALRAVLAERARQPDSVRAAADAELLLTDSLLRLAAHFYFGKVDPVTAAPRWDLVGVVRGEPAARVAARIAGGRAVALQLAELRPVQPMYGRLKSALARYRLIAEQGSWEPLPGGSVLQLGMEDPRVPVLRRRLALTGDFEGVVIDSPRFDPDLDRAVRRFQARHQLEPDGLFGPASVRELNRPVEERMDQLRVNLERARWLLSEVRGRFLLLDPAGGHVVLMDNSEPLLVLAASFAERARSASEFRAELRFVVLNPDWTLPASLVQSQVAPLARRRPAELASRGLEIFDLAGQPLDPARADWSRPERLVVRQRPGEGSFLGSVRFGMPNPAGLFLHGGAADGGALAGSVRLEEPLALAKALAGPPPSWTAEQLAQALDSPGTPRTFALTQPLPVLYAHWTAWVQSDGLVHFRATHAAQDAALLAGLLRGDASD